MCFLTFFFSSSIISNAQETDSAYTYRLISWNVENLYDTDNDTLKNDDAFTPEGENHWTKKRYIAKLNKICRVLAATSEIGNVMPTIVGLAEVENDKVLRDLTHGTFLRKYRYRFVHFDSPDARGIDNALLYREDYFKPFFSQAIDVTDSIIELITRDLLLVEGTTIEGDTLIVVMCHLPSKRGGSAADIRREHVAKKLRSCLDTIKEQHPQAAIVAMGDFNASPDEREIACLNGNGFVNMMLKMENGMGSHKYQGIWAYLDQIIVSSAMLDRQCPVQVGNAQVFALDFMLVDDERHLGKVPLRTYQGMKYLGGYSDHLPIGLDIMRIKTQ
ncbi:MAG: endonuclease [Bacteroidales bacterium]|nr:endonuclease [Bacteroidales bacterium]